MRALELSITFFLLLLFTACKPENTTVRFDRVQQYVLRELTDCIRLTTDMRSEQEPDQIRKTFKLARIAYKKAEPFLAIVNAASAHKVNGPPLPVFKEDNGKVLPPIGFQAIGEQLFGDEMDVDLLTYQIGVTLGYLNNLKTMLNRFPINERRYFQPIHQQFLRIFSLGITGFDTPSSLYGLEESIESLSSIQEVYTLAIGDTIEMLDESLHQDFLQNIAGAKNYLTINTDFDSFNRYEFGKSYINKLTNNWVSIRKISGLYDDPKKLALNLDAPTFFEKDAFRVDFFRSSSNRNPSDAQIRLGEKLFKEPLLSQAGDMSCISCHNPSLGYQDGLAKAVDNKGETLMRNTPTVINTIYQRKFFWDGRSDNLEQQITNVFDNKREFNSSAHAIQSSEIVADELYQELFKTAFPNRKLNRTTIIKAISSYVSTLNAMDSRFDQNMRGELDDFSEKEIMGMNLFMGKALCATCHFMPMTNGTVPPLFLETEKEILGTPMTADNESVDPDEGFYWVFKKDIHKYMFKTPTIRNVALTAPYMHNGVYETQEQVMDFYNQGGGAGLGFDLPHQTLPFDSLALSKEEQDAIIAFMETFTDEVHEEGVNYNLVMNE